MQNKNITPEVIDSFIHGRDPQKRIVNFECDYYSHEVTVIARNDFNKRVETKEPFYPFLWSTQKGAISLYNGDKSLIRQKMMEYGISCKGLNIYNADNKTTERMERGYRVLFYAVRPTSYNNFLRFFKEGGIDIYDSNRQFLTVTPVEQFMIQTGKRQFKGFEDYDDLLREVWDIETEGLNPLVHRITDIGIRTNKGFDYIIHVEGNTKEELDKSEITAINKFFYYLNEINPDIIAGHNSENFDWWFVMERCKVLGVNFEEITKKYLGYSIYKKKKKTVLKLGGEVEYFNQTVFFGHTIIDSLHACRRAQAIDSNMESSGLKYAAEYAKVKKPNRVFIPGDKISEVRYDTGDFLFNETNGEWYKLTDNLLTKTYKINYTNEETEKLKFSKINNDYFDNETNTKLSIVTGTYIVDKYLGGDLYEADKVELHFNQSNFQLAKILPMPYQKVCTAGTAGTWKMLLLAWSYENDLAVPMFGQNAPFVGGLSRLLKVGFVKDIVKLDFNSLYPSITISYNIFPDFDISGIFKSLLEYVLTEREKYKDLMKKANKNAKKLEEEIEKYDKETELYKETLNELNKFIKEGAKNDKLQLPFKIFGNSFFGSYGSPSIFMWGSLLEAEEITCTARQCLRLLTKWFLERKFIPIAMDTDGIDFSYTDVDLTYKYTSKGLNRNTVEGKEYTGIEAYVAEFSDLFLRGKMGLGIDDYALCEINFARKNRAEILEDGKLKMVGNTIKSRKMPTYIKNFLEENIKLLLHKNGKQFLINYYDYIAKIYNGNIPLRDIASKGKINKTVEEYKRDISVPNKNGGARGRQAWYELVIKDNVRTEIGETIYYVNIGTKKGDGDVKKEPIYKLDEDGNYATVDRLDENGNIVYSKRGKVPKPLKDKIKIGEEIVLNCLRIDKSIIEAENDIFGIEEELFETPIVYNYIKYVNQFNKRIKPLLVCFSPEIRDKILIENPEKKNYFTEKESELCAGFPNKPQDQDTLEQLLTIEDKEIKFWLKKEKTPPFIDELDMNWGKIVDEYNERLELIKREECLAEKEKFEKIVMEVTNKDIQNFFNDNNPAFIKEILGFCYVNDNNEFISQKHNIKIGVLDDILSKIFVEEVDDEDQEPSDINYKEEEEEMGENEKSED
jgi:DNA polymerase elongation subunit (family B)